MDLIEESLEEEMDQTAPGSEPIAQPRTDLIDTAVKFLTNPKVQQTPVDQRRAFLVKKGLTEEEINLALAKVQASNSASVAYQQGPIQPGYVGQPQFVPQRSSWRDYASLIVIVGGTSYAAFRLIREYILPRWFGYATPEQQRLVQLEQRIDELHNSVRFMTDSVQQTFGVVQDQKATVDRILTNLGETAGSSGTSGSIQELKSELSIVKSLLLSRNQFPPPLPTANSSKLPAWQLKPADQPETENIVSQTNGQTEEKLSNGTD